MSIIDLVIIAGVVIAGITCMVIFNSLVNKKNQVNFAWASLDAMLKKRYDLIPNLISTCEKYMGYEKGVLESLTQARTKAMAATATEVDKADADKVVTVGLRSIFAVAENYPRLKATHTFELLQRSLNEVEEQIAASRRAYNAAVTSYNNGCEMFPSSVAARMMGYQVKPWFAIPEAEREPVPIWR